MHPTHVGLALFTFYVWPPRVACTRRRRRRRSRRRASRETRCQHDITSVPPCRMQNAPPPPPLPRQTPHTASLHVQSALLIQAHHSALDHRARRRRQHGHCHSHARRWANLANTAMPTALCFHSRRCQWNHAGGETHGCTPSPAPTPAIVPRERVPKTPRSKIQQGTPPTRSIASAATTPQGT